MLAGGRVFEPLKVVSFRLPFRTTSTNPKVSRSWQPGSSGTYCSVLFWADVGEAHGRVSFVSPPEFLDVLFVESKKFGCFFSSNGGYSHNPEHPEPCSQVRVKLLPVGAIPGSLLILNSSRTVPFEFPSFQRGWAAGRWRVNSFAPKSKPG